MLKTWIATVKSKVKGKESETKYAFGVAENIESEAGAKRAFRSLMGYDRLPAGTEVESTDMHHVV